MMMARTRALSDEIAQRNRVRFELGEFNLQEPSVMDQGLRDMLAREAQGLAIDALAMPSGAGHDAQDFERAGFPAAMIFVRNAHGSHNPHEAMDMTDFALGTQLLARVLAT